MTIRPDYEVALLHMPTAVRSAMEALFAIDSAMAEVVARATDPRLGRIKLAWWREQLVGIDERTPPAEPRLRAVADRLLGAGISGAELGELETGWATLLDEAPDADLVAGRGARLFEIAGRLLGAGDSTLDDAGALFALQTAGFSDEAKTVRARLDQHRFARRVRPLTMLARAAAHDLRGGTPRTRVLAMLAHQWTGRIR